LADQTLSFLEFTEFNLKGVLLESFETTTAEFNDRHSYLIDYLSNSEVGAKSILIEHEYVDGDFLDDYAHYYVKCKKPYSRFCKRASFFKDVNATELEAQFASYLAGKADADEMISALGEKYLGFTIIKPLPTTVIGKTSIVPYRNSKVRGEDETGQRSIRCLRPYTATILGIPFKVESLAYIEQDRVIAACATSALWSAFQKTAYEFGYRIPTLYQITDLATMYSTTNRPIPSSGLEDPQICQAIKGIGLEPEYLEILDPARNYKNLLLANSYAYLRSGLPVIFLVLVTGMGGHAITVTGYRLREKGQIFNEVELANLKLPKGFKLKGSRIEAFYSHDDQIGPFCKDMVELAHEIRDEGGAQVVKCFPQLVGTWKDGQKQNIPLVPDVMVVPVYHKIRVPFSTVLKHAGRMDGILKAHYPGIDIEWDIFLSSVNAYKNEMSRRHDVPTDIRKILLESSHPRFIWRLRAFSSDIEVMEILADATDMELSFQVYRVSIFDTTLREFMVENKAALISYRQNDYFAKLLLELIW